MANQPVTDAEIQRMKQELLDDLNVIEKFQQLMAKRQNAAGSNGNGAKSQHDIKAPAPDGNAMLPEPRVSHPSGTLPLPIQPTDNTPARGTLINLVVEAVKAAGSNGIRPRDVLAYVVAKGYPFGNPDVAPSAVSTALVRLTNRDHKMEKNDSGCYVWKG